jgi:glycosyltransferase involved in cell wall biosynthesis
MNIIQVCPRYFPDIGGVETHVQEISERLVRQGHHVEVVCTDPRGVHPSQDCINGVHVRRFRSFAPNDAYFFAPGMFRYIRSFDADILHAHGYHAFPALFARMAAKKKIFIFTPHYHGKGHTPFRNTLLKFYEPCGRSILNRADRIICVSGYEKYLITNNYGPREEKFVVIPNGLNLSEFMVASDPGTKNPSRLLYIGRIEKYKGIQKIIDALPDLPEYTLTLVGKGPYESELRHLAVEKSVSDRITWKNDLSRQELIQEYSSAGVFISLSSYEAYGITVAEALASGLKVIVNRNGALQEFVDDEMCIGIEPSAERLVQAIHSMKAPSVYKKKIFDWDEVVEKIIQTYSDD